MMHGIGLRRARTAIALSRLNAVRVIVGRQLQRSRFSGWLACGIAAMMYEMIDRLLDNDWGGHRRDV